jgi:triosephosphate isomerase
MSPDRTPLIAGNWKMHKTVEEAEAFIGALLPRVSSVERAEVAICPTFTALQAMVDSTRGSRVAVYAQNMHQADDGAFTGEVSAPMLKALGVTHVILGHSERRHIFGESDELINRKVRAAVKHHLVPILCVGETAEEHDGGHTTTVILRQTQDGLAGLEGREVARMIIAYEPVWAIGTGRTASPAQASLAHGAIRETIGDSFGPECAAAVRILYGGSVTPENVDGLVAHHNIDGALVGGASLKADSFARIVRAGRSETHKA